MNLHLMRASTPSLLSLIGALLLSVVVLSDLAQCHVQQQDTVQHQPQQRNAIAASQSPSPTPYSSWPRNANSAANNYRRNPAPSPASNVCDYKMLMENLHDRVSVLVTLDENQRGSLEKIEKKLDHLEISNQARMESLSAQQMDFLKRLDSLEHIQRLTKHTIDELKDVSLTRSTRQAEGRIQEIFYTNNTQQQATQPRLPPQPPQRAEPTLLDIANRLDSLSFYTQLAISNLQANVTKLLQQTGNLQRRFNNVYRRNKNGQLGQQAVARQPTFYETNNSEQPLVTSCAQEAPLERNIIKFQLTHASDPFYVLCENEDIFNGDWTVILKRFNGAVNFNRDWLEYKAGFGNLAGEFFIGLEKLHALTASAVHELLIILEDFEGVRRYARYSYFAISGEDEQYAMQLLGAFEGDAGDSLVYHAGSKFSTFDHDNDGCLDCNCAQSRGGGWWFNWCARSNLMGIYYNQSMYSTSDDVVNGIFWDSFHTQHEALKKVKMMIRPIGGDEYRRR